MKFHVLLSSRTCLAACLSLFVFSACPGIASACPGIADEAASDDGAAAGEKQSLEFRSGEYKGNWESRDGRSGESILTINVDGNEFDGHLAIWGGRYAGDDVTGKIKASGKDKLTIEFKTKDGSLKSKGEFDGNALTGSYRYRYMVGRNRKNENVKWTLRPSANTP